MTGDFYTPTSDGDKKMVIKCTEHTILVFNGQNLSEESIESTLNLPAIISQNSTSSVILSCDLGWHDCVSEYVLGDIDSKNAKK